jgi:predicted HD phosphohydrolase
MIHAYGENPAAQGRDDRHELIGAKWLSKRLPASVTEPIRLHVAAKRYLCATDPGYAGQLAPDSVLSLALQGGAMSPGEAPAFRAEPFAEDAIATGADKQCHRPDAVVVNKSLLRIREVKS